MRAPTPTAGPGAQGPKTKPGPNGGGREGPPRWNPQSFPPPRRTTPFSTCGKGWGCLDSQELTRLDPGLLEPIDMVGASLCPAQRRLCFYSCSLFSPYAIPFSMRHFVILLDSSHRVPTRSLGSVRPADPSRPLGYSRTNSTMDYISMSRPTRPDSLVRVRPSDRPGRHTASLCSENVIGCNSHPPHARQAPTPHKIQNRRARQAKNPGRTGAPRQAKIPGRTEARIPGRACTHGAIIPSRAGPPGQEHVRPKSPTASKAPPTVQHRGISATWRDAPMSAIVALFVHALSINPR